MASAIAHESLCQKTQEIHRENIPFCGRYQRSAMFRSDCSMGGQG
jgi:hypothetical protein